MINFLPLTRHRGRKVIVTYLNNYRNENEHLISVYVQVYSGLCVFAIFRIDFRERIKSVQNKSGRNEKDLHQSLRCCVVNQSVLGRSWIVKYGFIDMRDEKESEKWFGWRNCAKSKLFIWRHNFLFLWLIKPTACEGQIFSHRWMSITNRPSPQRLWCHARDPWHYSYMI